MDKYLKIIQESYTGYWNYLVNEILYPSWSNYFYWLIGLSLLVWMLEIIIPWRKKQAVFRQDFWMDGFYMFFNYFLFSLIAYNAISNVAVTAFNDFIGLFGVKNLIAFQIQLWPNWAQLLLLFVFADFIQWNVHRTLHRIPWMWEFHKVHHSIKEMGFAAHLRFHWMESVFYKTAQYIPLAMIGFGLQDFFIVHIFTTAIGHFNHSNLNISYGPLKYIFNNPKMHIWHHAKTLPDGSYGVNYGLTLSIWDYIFKTNYIPAEGRDLELGFKNDEQFPKDLGTQLSYPFLKNRTN
ncbi:sterol desaturase family protein [Pedobacter cryophilus]|uniref:Sterol desaturase family protein n=1 Tax=Pedobacter cryophilus TaxID=2571271 RepID=A0A4U1BYT5_9SPHI|nr:sterol desaturase family protein [Pedobacter cryophilus]TKB97661.1 sterol desaturase family protein [Pedobacter cryophilus]